MISVATCSTVEEAEDVGRQLLEHNITPARIDGGVVFVDDADAERAFDVLDLQEAPPELTPPAPFHPCPSCGAADPRWYGKRKAYLLIALFVIVLVVVLLQSIAIVVVFPAAVVLFAMAIKFIPEFECRQCRHRWIKERSTEAR